MDSTPSPSPKSTIKIDHRTKRSIPTWLLHHMIRPFGPMLITAKKEYAAGSPQLKPYMTAKWRCNITERKVEDMYLYDLFPKRTTIDTRGRGTERRKRIYYFAGGGWQMPASSDHWVFCAAIAKEVPNAVVTLVS